MRELKQRKSQFQLTAENVEETTNITSDFDEGVIDSSTDTVSNGQRNQIVESLREGIISSWKTGKQIFELISDFVDGLLDRFDGRSEDDSTNFDDFNGFDLDNLSTVSTSIINDQSV